MVVLSSRACGRRLAYGGWEIAAPRADNLLVHEGRLVVIYLPQVVDVVGNPNGAQYLARDVRRIGEWFTARGHVGDPEGLLAELRAEIGLPPASHDG